MMIVSIVEDVLFTWTFELNVDNTVRHADYIGTRKVPILFHGIYGFIYIIICGYIVLKQVRLAIKFISMNDDSKALASKCVLITSIIITTIIWMEQLVMRTISYLNVLSFGFQDHKDYDDGLFCREYFKDQIMNTLYLIASFKFLAITTFLILFIGNLAEVQRRHE